MAVMTTPQRRQLLHMCPVAKLLGLHLRLRYLDSDGSYNGPIETAAALNTWGGGYSDGGSGTTIDADGNISTNGVVMVGAFSSGTAGSGWDLSSGTTAMRAYADDGGSTAITSASRAIWGRVLLTVNAGDTTFDGILGQAKINVNVLCSADFTSGVRGYLELKGGNTVNTGGANANIGAGGAALRGNISVDVNTTIAASHYLCGVHVGLSVASGQAITQTGVLCGYGVFADDQAGGATPTDRWGYGLYIASGVADNGINIVTAATTGIIIGTTTDAITIGTCTDGITITGATGYAIDIQTSGQFRMGVRDTGVATATDTPYAMQVYAKSSADQEQPLSGFTAAIRCRYEVGGDQTTACGYEAIDARLRVKKDLADGVHCGINGTIEASESNTSFGGTSTTQRSAGNFCLDWTSAVAVTCGWVCGVTIDNSVAVVDMSNCTFCGLHIKASGSSASDWQHGIYIAADCDAGITLGACTIGLNFLGVTPTCIYVTGVGTTASHVIDMVDAYTGMVIETGTYQSSVGGGITLASGNPRPVSFLFDDAGALLGSGSYRALLSRVYLGLDQTGAIALRAMRGQLTLANNVDLDITASQWNMVNGVEGYIQMLGTHAIGANTRLACLHSTLQITTAATVTSGGVLAGIFAELATETAATITAGWPVALYIDRLDSEHVTTQKKWYYGIYMAGCERGIKTENAFPGQFISTGTYSNSADQGITLAATNNMPVQFLFDDGGDALGAASYRALISRVMFTTSQSGASAYRAIRGQISAADGVNLDITASQWNMVNAVEGYVQLYGTHTIGANTRLACLHATLQVTTAATVTSGGVVAGIFAELASETAATFTAGWPVGLYIDKLDSQHASTQKTWYYGINIASDSCATGIQIGTCSTAAMVIGSSGTAAGDVYIYGGLANSYLLWDSSEDRFVVQNTFAADANVSTYEYGQYIGMAFNTDITTGKYIAGLKIAMEGTGDYDSGAQVYPLWVDFQNTGTNSTATSAHIFLQCQTSACRPDAYIKMQSASPGVPHLLYLTNTFAPVGALSGTSDVTFAGGAKKISIDIAGTEYFLVACVSPAGS